MARIDGICFLELIIKQQYTLKQKMCYMGHTGYAKSNQSN